MRQQIIGDINAKLSALKLPVTLGSGADVTVHTEFLNASTSIGSKKISYIASVYLDEAKQTVFMYEKTAEVGHGISFGESEETSFQSGKTLFRKVKGVQYGVNGEKYEYNLDLGAIPRAVKETAELYGWKFKTVLSLQKASYPAGYVPNMTGFSTPNPVQQPQTISGKFCSNCGAMLKPDAAFCENCGSSAKPKAPPEQATPSYSPPSQTTPSYAPTPAFNEPVQPMPGTPKKKAGVLFWILFGLCTVISLLFGLTAGIAITGILITVAILILMFILGFKGVIRKPVASIIVWILVLAALLFIQGAFMLSSNNAKGDLSNGSASPNAAQADVKADPSKAVFVVSAIRSNISPSIVSEVDSNQDMLYKPLAYITTFIDLQTLASSVTDENAKLTQLSFDNIKETAKPKKGSLSYYVSFSDPSTDDSKFTSQSSYKQVFTDSTFIMMSSYTLHMKIDNISDYFKISDTTVDSSHVIDKVATWEDLKYTLEFDINAVTKDGSVYTKHIVVSMPQGDFMNDENALNYDVTYDLNKDIAKAMLVKK